MVVVVEGTDFLWAPCFKTGYAGKNLGARAFACALEKWENMILDQISGKINGMLYASARAQKKVSHQNEVKKVE